MISEAMTSIRIRPAVKKLRGLWKPARLKILHGGRGSGKSMGVAEYVIARATTSKIRVLCCREIQKSIRESAKQLLAETIERLGLSEHWRILESELRCVNGSEIVFEGLHRNLTKIKGFQGISICWVEEGESVSKESFDVLFPTIREEDSEIIITFNPRFASDPAYQLILNPPSFAWIQEVNWYDNPLFPEVLRLEMEECKRLNPDDYAWIWEGKPMGQGANALIQAALVHEAMNRLPLREVEKPLVVGLDVARFGDDESVAVGVRGFEIVFVRKVRGLDTVALAEWARGIFYEYSPKAFCIDSAGSAGCFDLVHSQLSRVCKIVPFNGANKPTRPEFHNARTDSWAFVRDWLRDGGALTRDSWWHDCESVTYRFTPANKKLLESKQDLKLKIGHSPDEVDALAMAIWPPAIAEAARTEEEVYFDQYETAFAG